ncbi:MAG: MFS transporter [bacterium]|nr:MFS transporter [bacterium]
MASTVVGTPAVERVNFTHLVFDVAWFGLALAATTRFLTPYAIRLDATSQQLALMAALPGIALLVATSLAIWWRRLFNSTVKSLFWPGLGQRLVFLLPAMTPLFPREWQPYWLILAATLPNIPTGISGAIFNMMLREAISQERMNSLLSQRSLALNLALAAGTLAFGFLLQSLAFPTNYPLIFLIAFAFALISQVHVISVRVVFPASLPAPQRQEMRKSVWFSREFLPVALVAFLVHVGFFTLISITPMHLMRSLNADEAYITLFGLVELGSGAVIALFTGTIMRRMGASGLIVGSMLGLALAAVIFGVGQNLTLMLIGAVLSGASWSAAGIVGIYAIMYERVPQEQTSQWAMAHLQAIALGVFVGPLLGDALINLDINLPLVILLCGGIRLLVGIFTHFLLVPRSTTREVLPVEA